EARADDRCPYRHRFLPASQERMSMSASCRCRPCVGRLDPQDDLSDPCSLSFAASTVLLVKSCTTRSCDRQAAFDPYFITKNYRCGLDLAQLSLAFSCHGCRKGMGHSRQVGWWKISVVRSSG